MSGTSSRRWRRAGVAAVLTAAVAAVAGCSVDPAGAAAVVGDQQVAESQVAADVAEVQAQVPPGSFDSAAVTKATVTRLTQGLLVADAATREGVDVTQTQVDALLAAGAKSAGSPEALQQALVTQYSVPASAVEAYARTFLEQQALAKRLAPAASDHGEAALTAYLGKLSEQLGTQISPRYGTWNPTSLSLGPVPTDLASPVSSSP